MLSLFGGNVGKLLKFEAVATDNMVFRLHYKVTIALLIISMILLGAKQYFGEPIHCRVDGLDAGTMNMYCLIHGTWTTKEFVTDAMAGQVAHPGMGMHDESKHEKVFHTYYQWVPLALLISATGFYLPRCFWKWAEGGLLSQVCDGMMQQDLDEKDYISSTARKDLDRLKRRRRNNNALAEEEEGESDDDDDEVVEEKQDVKLTVTGTKVNRLLNFYRVFRIRNGHYALKFFVCEFLNLVQVLLQFYAFDWLFKGAFSTFGQEQFDYWSGTEEEKSVFLKRFWESGEDDSRMNPWTLHFPKIAHCTYRKHGPTGDIQTLEGTCLLPLNILNEKIFLVLWVWFIFLGATTSLSIVYRFCCLLFRPVRRWNLRARLSFADYGDVTVVCDHATISEWFILKQLSRNVNVYTMDKFFVFLAETYREEAKARKHNKMQGVKQGLRPAAHRKQSVLSDYAPMRPSALSRRLAGTPVGSGNQSPTVSNASTATTTDGGNVPASLRLIEGNIV